MVSEGFLTKKFWIRELRVYAKYLFYKGFNEYEVKAELTKFCFDHIPLFRYEDNFNIINKTIQLAKNSKLIHDINIYIYQQEIEEIKQLEPMSLQKVAFAMLMIFKFYNHKNFKMTRKDIFEIARVRVQHSRQIEIMHELNMLDIIGIDSYSRRYSNIAVKDGDIAIKITTIENGVLEYLAFTKDDCGAFCCICGRKIGNKLGRYCSKCSVRRKRESWRKASKSYRLRKEGIV